jgi:phage terminase large subunit-like protein
MPSPNRLDAMVWALTELMLDYCATELGSIEFPML